MTTAELRALLAQVRAMTKGPWCWRDFGRNTVLATERYGALIVLDARCAGPGRAVLRAARRTGTDAGIMVDQDAQSLNEHPDGAGLVALRNAAEAILTELIERREAERG